MIEPTTATNKLYRFKPVTPEAPRALNIHPPATAPIIPSTISRIRPSPLLLTILLPINPATKPRMTQAKSDISVLLISPLSALEGHRYGSPDAGKVTCGTARLLFCGSISIQVRRQLDSRFRGPGAARED